MQAAGQPPSLLPPATPPPGTTPTHGPAAGNKRGRSTSENTPQAPPNPRSPPDDAASRLCDTLAGHLGTFLTEWSQRPDSVAPDFPVTPGLSSSLVKLCLEAWSSVDARTLVAFYSDTLVDIKNNHLLSSFAQAAQKATAD